MVHCAKNTHR